MSKKISILIVDDEESVRSSLYNWFIEDDYRVDCAEDAKKALSILESDSFDIVLADIKMPGMDGLEMLKRIKSFRKDAIVIVMTAFATVDTAVQALKDGAFDYITKPFSPRELLARIAAVLRRAAPGHDEEIIQLNGLKLDGSSHRVTVADRVVSLGPTEYRLLSFFMTHTERVYSRSQLLDRVWGGNVYVEERTVDVHIRRLRKALEEFGVDQYIQTVRGSGYRFSTKPE